MIIIRIMGGLGNQMFQYALFQDMLSKNYNVTLDLSWYSRDRAHNGYELKRVFNIAECCADPKLTAQLGEIEYDIFHRIYYRFIQHKKTYYYQTANEAILFDEKVYEFDNVYLSGYWQSEKYFSRIEDVIRKIYVFPDIIDDNNIKIKKEILANNSVSLHVRRGDYLKSADLGGICTKKYYQKAIRYIKETVNMPFFFVFSDDISWCKENLELSSVRYVEGNQGENSYRDMQLMSLCKHNIIANSSFSWWGAWLNSNKDKVVIAPEIWFKNRSVSTKDLLLEQWIKF